MGDEMQIVNINQVTPQEKYSLEKTVNEILELKIFFFGVLNGGNVTRLTGVIAYRHSDAVQRAHELWGTTPGTMVFGNDTDNETVKNLLQNINLEGLVNTVTLKPPEEKVMPIERFKASLIMATAEYVTEENDRSELRRIISTINVPQKI